jgi:hypothetical protein
MNEVLTVQAIGITEHRGCLFEGNTVFLEIGDGLSNIPGKHICVYTLRLLQNPQKSTSVADLLESYPRKHWKFDVPLLEIGVSKTFCNSLTLRPFFSQPFSGARRTAYLKGV